MEKRIEEYEIKILKEVDKKFKLKDTFLKTDDEISQLLTELHKRFLFSKDLTAYFVKKYKNIYILSDFYEQLKLEREIAECIYEHESAESTKAKTATNKSIVENPDTREQEIRRHLKTGNKRLNFKKSNGFCGLCQNENCLITEKISLYPDLLEYFRTEANINEIDYSNLLKLKQQRNHEKHNINYRKLKQLRKDYDDSVHVIGLDYYRCKGITKDLVIGLIDSIRRK